MRCKECNVDLPESYNLCPLCGKEASDDKPLFKDIKYVPYPRGQYKAIPIEPIKTKGKISIARLKAFFNL